MERITKERKKEGEEGSTGRDEGKRDIKRRKESRKTENN